ncbi:MAG: acetate--CoA ligase family protein [Paracoccaceae bacterium]
MADLSRLLSARSIAVVGGGAWCASIIGAAQRIGYQGDIFPVHPTGKDIAGLRAIKRLQDRDGPIDCAFVGVNRHATIEVIQQLNDLNAGGAVCFASGFAEAASEESDAINLQTQLIQAAGDMPILGPNCYGFVNALDKVAVWPDQHGMAHVERGVAILTQSSNIAINLTMQKRGVPIAYAVTCGNQAQTTQASIARHLLNDTRVTAIGLHIEGFGDTREWIELAKDADAMGKTLVALKVGRSSQAQIATMSHTASLAGSDAGANALLDRLGIIRVDDLATFLETLKLLHVTGGLDAPTLSSISCSGGEASLMADLVEDLPLTLPSLVPAQTKELRAALGPMVALANPLDYHTYIWRDTPSMVSAWSAMAAPHIGITLSVVDYPHTDAGDWVCATDAALAVRHETGRPVGVVASLPELMPDEVAKQLMAGGVVPFNGMVEALKATALVANKPAVDPVHPFCAAPSKASSTLISEAQAKADLARFGLDVPKGQTCMCAELHRVDVPEPLVLKSVGLAHKSDSGGVKLNLSKADLETTAITMPGSDFLVETMITHGTVELIVGVVRDPAHGFVLTIGAGGILTELMQDTVSMLVPASRNSIHDALQRLKVWPLIEGYRGKPGADVPSILKAVDSIQAYVAAEANTVEEIEINPLICTPTQAIAADALIRKG